LRWKGRCVWVRSFRALVMAGLPPVMIACSLRQPLRRRTGRLEFPQDWFPPPRRSSFHSPPLATRDASTFFALDPDGAPSPLFRTAYAFSTRSFFSSLTAGRQRDFGWFGAPSLRVVEASFLVGLSSPFPPGVRCDPVCFTEGRSALPKHESLFSPGTQKPFPRLQFPVFLLARLVMASCLLFPSI